MTLHALPNEVPVAGLPAITTPTRRILLDDLKAHFQSGRGFAVATVNLDHVVKLRRDQAFRNAYARHSHVVADGNPIVWVNRIAGRNVSLITGADLVDPLVALAAQLSLPIAFIGSSEETLNLATKQLTTLYPGLQVVAHIAPSYDFDPYGNEGNICLEQLEKSGARLCFVALGAPKQEVFAMRGRDRLPQCGFVSVGAGLDFIAKTQRRAPKWVRRIAMEWLWRLAGDRKRLARRYRDSALVLPGLVIGALRERWSGKTERLG